MNCKQYQELLSPYLDGVLRASQQRSLESHLRRCPSCREELEALRRAVNLLRAWSEEEMDLPAGFEERLRSRLELACRPWYRHLPRSWLSLAAAAAIMVAAALTAYSDYFRIPRTFSAGLAPAVTREEKVQDHALQSPAVPDQDYSLRTYDQATSSPVQEMAPLPDPDPPPAPKREQKSIKSPRPLPVLNGRERSPTSQPGNNFRGQKQDPALNATLAADDGKTETETAPAGAEDSLQPRGKGGGSSGADNNTGLPGDGEDGTAIDDSGPPATVPGEVYKNPQQPAINMNPATTPAVVTPPTGPETTSSPAAEPGKPSSP